MIMHTSVSWAGDFFFFLDPRIHGSSKIRTDPRRFRIDPGFGGFVLPLVFGFAARPQIICFSFERGELDRDVLNAGHAGRGELGAGILGLAEALLTVLLSGRTQLECSAPAKCRKVVSIKSYAQQRPLEVDQEPTTRQDRFSHPKAIFVCCQAQSGADLANEGFFFSSIELYELSWKHTCFDPFE